MLLLKKQLLMNFKAITIFLLRRKISKCLSHLLSGKF